MFFKRKGVRIEDLLDGKNKGLYENVNQSLNLSLKETDEPYYGIFTKGSCAELQAIKASIDGKIEAYEKPLTPRVMSDILAAESWRMKSVRIKTSSSSH